MKSRVAIFSGVTVRVLAVLFLLFLIVGEACAKVKVVTSLSDLAEFTRAVGGDRVEVDFLVRGTQNPHYIEVKPSYMLKLKSAHLFVVIGMQLELWAGQIIDGSRNPNLIVLDCSRSIEKLEVPSGRIDARAGDVHPFGNPHYWLDPHNVKAILQEIFDQLVKLSPADRGYFRQNMDAYIRKLDEKMEEWKKLMEDLRGATIVTYHSSFSYFAERFGISVAGYIEPKPGIPPTPGHTAELISLMRRAGVRVIGVEQYFETGTPTRVANATGAVVVQLCTSVGGLPGLDNYIAVVDHNVRTLSSALRSR